MSARTEPYCVAGAESSKPRHAIQNRGFEDSAPATPPQADLEDILERFDRAWQRGPRPSLANYLLPAGHPQRHELLVELVRIDLEYRLKAGDETPWWKPI